MPQAMFEFPLSGCRPTREQTCY